MPSLHPREIWEKTGRNITMNDILYRTEGAGGHHFVFGPSHEEVVTPLAKKSIRSYKDLPFAVYQLQTKFRNEPRAKSGVLRGREFGMKDMYSFHTTDEDLDAFYGKAITAYFNVFRRCGLDAFIAEASGGAFSDKFSHEFSVRTQAGEDTMLFCEKCRFARNSEIAKGDQYCPKCKSELREEKAIEAGNIFKLGTKYSKDFDLTFMDENGKEKLVIMGCYGIGATRLVGTIVEASHDEKGMIWPEEVAPYLVHLVNLGTDREVFEAAEKFYASLRSKNIEVLFDDRDESTGKKLNDADLIGIPYRLILSKKTLAEEKIEVKKRSENEARLVTESQFYENLSAR